MLKHDSKGLLMLAGYHMDISVHRFNAHQQPNYKEAAPVSESEPPSLSETSPSL